MHNPYDDWTFKQKFKFELEFWLVFLFALIAAGAFAGTVFMAMIL